MEKNRIDLTTLKSPLSLEDSLMIRSLPVREYMKLPPQLRVESQRVLGEYYERIEKEEGWDQYT